MCACKIFFQADGYFYFAAGPRSRKTRKQETLVAEEKRPRTAFNAQQLGRLKVCELMRYVSLAIFHFFILHNNQVYSLSQHATFC